MAQKVAKLGVKRDNNFLYYIKGGDVWRVARKQPGAKKGKPEKAATGGITKEAGFIYFLDSNGDISRAKMAVGGQKRKKKAVKAKAKKTVAKKKTAKAKKR
jgi:hypothetical protein